MENDIYLQAVLKKNCVFGKSSSKKEHSSDLLGKDKDGNGDGGWKMMASIG